MNNRPYVGRFAPSPSGPLHFGSLVCALASYLHAKQHDGTWLLRIEDVDAPRVEKGMADNIIASLQQHHLQWDGNIIYQSQAHVRYEEALKKLAAARLLYACKCSRREAKARSASYDGYCRNANHPLTTNAIRFNHNVDNSRIEDLFWGSQHITAAIACEDPILKRRDGIYSYHLAVVVDDIDQQVTHVVRGLDLIDTTPVHLSLYQALNKAPPSYLHIPVIVQKKGEKLSKQHYSPAINGAHALENLKLALNYLGFACAFDEKSSIKTSARQSRVREMASITAIPELLAWATEHWTTNLIPKQREILISVADGVYSTPKTLNEVKV